MLVRVDLTLDASDASALAAFWKTAAGYVDEPPPPPFTSREEWLAAVGEEGDDIRDAAWLIHPNGIAPRLAILRVPEPKTAKNRLHLDLRVTTGLAPEQRWPTVIAEVERLCDAGGTVLHVVQNHHVVMADPEGNEFCVA